MTIAIHIVGPSLELVLLSVESWLSTGAVITVESSASAVSAHPLRLSAASTMITIRTNTHIFFPVNLLKVLTI